MKSGLLHQSINFLPSLRVYVFLYSAYRFYRSLAIACGLCWMCMRYLFGCLVVARSVPCLMVLAATPPSPTTVCTDQGPSNIRTAFGLPRLAALLPERPSRPDTTSSTFGVVPILNWWHHVVADTASLSSILQYPIWWPYGLFLA
jgi:hypothetical protein